MTLSRRRAARVLLGLLLAAAALGMLPVSAGAEGAAGPPTPSAITKTGTGPFAGLHVTVSQTANLVDQKVLVSWTGGLPTQPGGNNFAQNYLQIMQCWGDQSPDATQCQFGARFATDSRGGAFTASRQLDYGQLVDPLVVQAPKPSMLPFVSVTGDKVDTNTNSFFDGNTTNELPYNGTSPDGTGQAYFETQTAFEAPGLGCGQTATVNGVTGPRSCWLVVVPRDDHEVDGTVRGTASTDELVSSPLSPTNWAQRIVFPLSFAPLGEVCPIGAHERRTVGVESVADAMVRWQPALCSNGGPVFGYSQVPDSVARRQVLSLDPGLAFLNGALTSDQNPQAVPLTYAPVALSGLAIAFNIDYQAPSSAPPEAHQHDGEQMTGMKLTPRLVAKLITQSYLLGAQTAPYLNGNPTNLITDPDFLRLNPQYQGLNLSVPTMLEPLGNSDANRLLWQWIGSDQDAMAFLAGYPDPWGMRVNPFYQGLSTDLDQFPKQDPYCQQLKNAPIPLCTLDRYPYTNSLHDSARAAGRGDTLARDQFDAQATPPAFKKAPVQVAGQQSIVTFADGVTAQRYGLATAELLNGSGSFVAPSDASILAGYAAMKPSGTPGVLMPDPSAGGAAYPLSLMTYAATSPGRLTVEEAKDYADLVRFAAGAGQTVGFDLGQMPLGYVPLPAAQRSLALEAATRIANRVAPVPASPSSSPVSASAPTPVASAQATASGRATGPEAPVASVASPSVVALGLTPQVAPGPPVIAPAAPTLEGLRTPAAAVGAGRFAVVSLLVVGGAAAGASAALPMWARRRTRHAVA